MTCSLYLVASAADSLSFDSFTDYAELSITSLLQVRLTLTHTL